MRAGKGERSALIFPISPFVLGVHPARVVKLVWKRLSHPTFHPGCLDKPPPSPWSQRRPHPPPALSPSPRVLLVLPLLDPHGWHPQEVCFDGGDARLSTTPPIPGGGAMLQIRGWSCWCLSEACALSILDRMRPGCRCFAPQDAEVP